MLKRIGGFATQDAAKIAGRKENEEHSSASAGHTGSWTHLGGTECGEGYAVLTSVMHCNGRHGIQASRGLWPLTFVTYFVT
jgi:hypothetical protein